MKKTTLKQEGLMDLVLVQLDQEDEFVADFDRALIRDYSEDGDSFDLWMEDNDEIELWELPVFLKNQTIGFFSNHGDEAKTDQVICRHDFDCFIKDNFIFVDDPDGFDIGQIVMQDFKKAVRRIL